MSFTKSETREIFDRSKIGIGDIVEINDHKREGFWGKLKITRVPAIVFKVEDDVLILRLKEDPEFDSSNKYHLGGFGIGIERQDEIKMIYRSPYNQK